MNQFASSTIRLLRSILISFYVTNKRTKFLSTNIYISRYGTSNRLFLHKNNFMEMRNFYCSKRPKNSVQRPPFPPKKSNTVIFHYKNHFEINKLQTAMKVNYYNQ